MDRSPALNGYDRLFFACKGQGTQLEIIVFSAVLLILAGVLVLVLRLRNGQPSRSSVAPRKSARTTPKVQLSRLQQEQRYRGVRIEARCSASARFVGHEYSFERAPQLPAIGCDATVCTCSYIGLPDRRGTSDRRVLADRRASIRMNGRERRSKHPRRKTDVAVWATN